jgi:hypothetical protein
MNELYGKYEACEGAGKNHESEAIFYLRGISMFEA